MQTRINLLTVILVLTALLYSCGTPESNFFILTPVDGYEQNRSESNSDISIGISNIELPDYLRKPQIVTYAENNEIMFDEFNRWAEPLEDNFTRIIVENISALIPTNNVFLFMWPKEDPNIFQITIQIDQFGLMPDSNVVLDARWSVSSSNKKSLLLKEKSSYKEKANSLEYGQITVIMSNLIGDLSKDIASDVKEKAARN